MLTLLCFRAEERNPSVPQFQSRQPFLNSSQPHRISGCSAYYAHHKYFIFTPYHLRQKLNREQSIGPYARSLGHEDRRRIFYWSLCQN